MTILDETAYRALTGDTLTYSAGVVVASIGNAQSQLEYLLRRPLESIERTEHYVAMRLRQFYQSTGYPVRDYYKFFVFPLATPVTVVPAGFVLETTSKVSGPFDYQGYFTYTGGYTAGTCPYVLKKALAGLTQLNLGEVGAYTEGDIIDPEGNVVPVVPPFGSGGEAGQVEAIVNQVSGYHYVPGLD